MLTTYPCSVQYLSKVHMMTKTHILKLFYEQLISRDINLRVHHGNCFSCIKMFDIFIRSVQLQTLSRGY